MRFAWWALACCAAIPACAPPPGSYGNGYPAGIRRLPCGYEGYPGGYAAPRRFMWIRVRAAARGRASASVLAAVRLRPAARRSAASAGPGGCYGGGRRWPAAHPAVTAALAAMADPAALLRAHSAFPARPPGGGGGGGRRWRRRSATGRRWWSAARRRWRRRRPAAAPAHRSLAVNRIAHTLRRASPPVRFLRPPSPASCAAAPPRSAP